KVKYTPRAIMAYIRPRSRVTIITVRGYLSSNVSEGPGRSSARPGPFTFLQVVVSSATTRLILLSLLPDRPTLQIPHLSPLHRPAWPDRAGPEGFLHPFSLQHRG